MALLICVLGALSFLAMIFLLVFSQLFYGKSKLAVVLLAFVPIVNILLAAYVCLKRP